MESKLILAFHVAPQKLGKIRFCAMKMGMRVMDVPLADCGQTLGALCGKAERQTDAAALENAVGGEMLYFAFSELPLVERFLTTMKQMRVPPGAAQGRYDRNEPRMDARPAVSGTDARASGNGGAWRAHPRGKAGGINDADSGGTRAIPANGD